MAKSAAAERGQPATTRISPHYEKGAESVRKIILAIMAAAATILGLVNNAQAEAVNVAHQTSSTVNLRHRIADPGAALTSYLVPGGVESELSIPNICTNATPTATGLPHGVYVEQTTKGLLLVGDWPPGTLTVTLTCPGGIPSENISVRAEPGSTAAGRCWCGRRRVPGGRAERGLRPSREAPSSQRVRL